MLENSPQAIKPAFNTTLSTTTELYTIFILLPESPSTFGIVLFLRSFNFFSDKSPRVKTQQDQYLGKQNWENEISLKINNLQLPQLCIASLLETKEVNNIDKMLKKYWTRVWKFENLCSVQKRTLPQGLPKKVRKQGHQSRSQAFFFLRTLFFLFTWVEVTHRIMHICRQVTVLTTCRICGITHGHASSAWCFLFKPQVMLGSMSLVWPYLG